MLRLQFFFFISYGYIISYGKKKTFFFLMKMINTLYAYATFFFLVVIKLVNKGLLSWEEFNG